MDFHPVAIDTADNLLPAIKYILSLDISPTDKAARIQKIINLIGSDFYVQMFDANSEVFDSTAIGSTDYSQLTGQIDTLATKIVRQYSLGRPINPIVREFYDTALGHAQEEAFRNALSLDKHPTLTRSMVGETCDWCYRLSGVYTYPDSECFARHEHCDCLLVTSGYNTRNGVVNNYVKYKNSKERQEHLKPTLKELKSEPNEVTVGFVQVLEGQKKEAKIGNIYSEATKALGVNRKAEISITRSSALHMDNSGHFSGTGFTKNGHDDPNPLTTKQITDIPRIVKNATGDNTVLHNTSHANKRFTILGDARDRQVVIVDVADKNSINVVTSYKVSEYSYQRLMWEAMQNER